MIKFFTAGVEIGPKVKTLPDLAIFRSRSDAIVFRYPLIAVEVNLRIGSVEANMNSGYLWQTSWKNLTLIFELDCVIRFSSFGAINAEFQIIWMSNIKLYKWSAVKDVTNSLKIYIKMLESCSRTYHLFSDRFHFAIFRHPFQQVLLSYCAECTKMFHEERLNIWWNEISSCLSIKTRKVLSFRRDHMYDMPTK